MLHGSRVARELALSTARTVVDDPELKAIIRESQDISKQISTLKNNLRQILALPEDQIDVGIALLRQQIAANASQERYPNN